METQNITLALSKDVLHRARMLAVERRTSLSALLAQMEHGGAVIIKPHGRPIAMLTPIDIHTLAEKVIVDVDRLRSGDTMGVMSIREMAER